MIFVFVIKLFLICQDDARQFFTLASATEEGEMTPELAHIMSR